MKKQKAVHLCESCDAPLSTKRKYCDARCEHIEICKKLGPRSYKNTHVAPMFQRMIRAEAGADASLSSRAVVDGRVVPITRRRGYCVCVTCGLLCPWEGGRFEKQLHCGHFLAGRGSILFEPECVAPQCSGCNRHHGGRPLEFRLWMEAVHGTEVIERLELLKRQPRSFSRDELVDMFLAFRRRLNSAIAHMKGTTND